MREGLIEIMQTEAVRAAARARARRQIVHCIWSPTMHRPSRPQPAAMSSGADNGVLE